MHLREYVNERDVDLAISMMLESFFQSQKQSVRRPLERKFRRYLHVGGESRARSHCRSVLPFIQFAPDSLTYSVPLF